MDDERAFVEEQLKDWDGSPKTFFVARADFYWIVQRTPNGIWVAKFAYETFKPVFVWDTLQGGEMADLVKTICADPDAFFMEKAL